MSNAQLLSQFAAARRVSTPLIAINTPDQAATISLLREKSKPSVPMYTWDTITGLVPANEAGLKLLSAVGLSEAALQEAETINCINAVVIMAQLPTADLNTDGSGGALIFARNFHMYLKEGEEGWRAIRQGVANLRDEFVMHGKTLVMLGPNVPIPPELTGSVLVLDEPLPDEEILGEVTAEICEGASLKMKPDEKEAAVFAMRGLPRFAANQAAAMAVAFDKKGKTSHLDISELWRRKEQSVNETRGLKFQMGKDSFDTIGGLSSIKDFCRKIFDGVDPPNLVIHLDEIEKALAGSEGDTSGVSQDQVGVLLQAMEDNGWTGLIAVGFPGTGKSQLAKAVGNYKIRMDLGDMMGSLVGQSQEMIRAAIKVIAAIGGERVFFVATSNDISKLRPELIRRFPYGRWMFDLPDKSAREAIWSIYLDKYGLDKTQALPNDIGWTGAEIKTSCLLAHRMRLTLLESSQFVVPFKQSNAEYISVLRQQAKGRYLCASHAGPYQPPDDEITHTVDQSTAAQSHLRRFTQN